MVELTEPARLLFRSRTADQGPRHAPLSSFPPNLDESARNRRLETAERNRSEVLSVVAVAATIFGYNSTVSPALSESGTISEMDDRAKTTNGLLLRHASGHRRGDPEE